MKEFNMFSEKSEVFVSTEDGYTGNLSVKAILEGIAAKERPYAMSYHSEFQRVDYTEIERIETYPGVTSVMELNFVNNYDINYILNVDPYQRIFTVMRGYLPAIKINEKDIFVDITGKLCKLVSKRSVPFNGTLYDFGIMHNRSLFCNGILIRSI